MSDTSAVKSGGITRRDVLLGAGAAAIAPWKLLAQEQTRPVGWAVLGLGGYASIIMSNFRHCQRSRLVGLITGHPSKLVRYGEQYGIKEQNRYTYEQMDRIGDNPEIDVVYVITPPATHPEFVIRAAKAGKHVCSEKPMAPTVADCRRMIDACKAARKLLQIGYRCHYEAHNLAAIQICRSGQLGKIASMRSDHGFDIQPGTWRTQRALAGGGSMMDIGIYSLNALRYLSGEEPVSVNATITNPPNDERFRDCEDTVDFTLKFPSGREGHGTGGYSWRQGKNRYEVSGDKGTLLADPATAYEGDRLTLNGTEYPLTTNNQWAAQIDHMSECVRTGGKVKTPGEEGMRDIRIIQAIYESARTGRAVGL